MNIFRDVGWSLYPSVLIGISLLTLIYIRVNSGREISLGRRIVFHLGTLVALLALVSPLDGLGDEFLFSAHMIQHLLLIFVSAPLWLIGTPSWILDGILPQAVERQVKQLFSPIYAFVIFVSVLWFWHIPPIYELAQASEAVHILEHLSFIGAGLIGWYPAAGPQTRKIPKPEAPLRIFYLFLLAIPCTSLAAVLTFASSPLYPFYMNAPHLFGLDALQDQRLGGLLMWMPTHMILLLAIGITFTSWFRSSEREVERISELAEDPNRYLIQPVSQTQEIGV